MCQTYLVTGGYIWGSDFFSSTELLVKTAASWVFTGHLPSPRGGLKGANIDGRILMTGNKLRLLIRELFGFAIHDNYFVQEAVQEQTSTMISSCSTPAPGNGVSWTTCWTPEATTPSRSSRLTMCMFNFFVK